MNHDLAKQLTENVRDFYEKQGAWFATTRGKIMPEQAFVEARVNAGMTVVDVGAGNGRFAKLLPQGVKYIGIEPSQSLLARFSILHSRFSIVPGSLPCLSLPDEMAHITVCLAVLHHIPMHEERLASVQELIRITKSGGIILATSWLRNPHHDRATIVQKGEPGDSWMPWIAPDGQTSQRFVHFMQDDEWRTLWMHNAIEILRIGMHGKRAWTKDVKEGLNWRMIARKK